MSVNAPWDHHQVEALNAYQRLNEFHEFTCGNDHSGDRKLIATPSGWKCPVCDYTQTWAHDFMVKLGEEELARRADSDQPE